MKCGMNFFVGKAGTSRSFLMYKVATQILLQKLLSNKHLFEAQRHVGAIVLHFICV